MFCVVLTAKLECNGVGQGTHQRIDTSIRTIYSRKPQIVEYNPSLITFQSVSRILRL